MGQLAAKMRAKYPGAYDDLSDADLEAKVLAKYPEYRDLAEPQESAAARFGRGVLRTTVEPMADLAKTALTTAPWNFPKVIGEQIAGGMIETGKKAVAKGREALSAPNLPQALLSGSEALGYGAASALPVLGPVAAGIGERAASGDIAGAAGEVTGLAAPGVVKRVSGPLRASIGEQVAAKAEQMGTNRLTDVMVPKVGQNKIRFGNRAAEVAPTLAREKGLGAISREGFQQKIEARLAEAETALDAAAQARSPTATFRTKQIIADLRAKRQEMVAEAVQGSRATPTRKPYAAGEGKPSGEAGVKLERRPLGADVVPGPNNPRVAVIDRAIAELEQLGPVAKYEPLRRIRQAYDAPAKAIYSPSMTADYMARMGEKLGAADVTGVLRQHLAKFDPKTAAANADYSLYKAASDVLRATEEVQRSRPTVGRRMVAAATGGALGNVAAPGTGMAVGLVLGPLVDEAIAAGLTTKITTARTLTSLADAIRKNQTKRATTLLGQLQRGGRLASVKTQSAQLPQAAEQKEPEAQYAR